MSSNNYVVTVNTGAESTNYDVSIKLIGSNGKEFEKTLDLSNLTYSTQSTKRNATIDKTNLFEKNEKDIFTIAHTESIGDLTSVLVRTIKKGMMPQDDWTLKNIMVETPEKKMFMFTHNKIIVNDPVTIPKDATDFSDYVYYNITIKTANVPNAGSDANMTMKLNGTGEALVLTSETSENAWEQNKTDTMKIFTKNAGNLTSITLISDNDDLMSADWCVENVSITSQKLGEQPSNAVVFNNNNKVFINKKANSLNLVVGDQPVPVAPASAAAPGAAAPAAAGPKAQSLASILRASAAQEYITQQLRTQFAALSGQLAEKCNKCNVIIPALWKQNDCEDECIKLEATAANNRGLFKKRSDLLKQLESVTTPQLVKILPDSKDRALFYTKFFYERLKQTGSFEDSMIDMNDKLEDFIQKVEDIHAEFATKDTDLSSSTDDRIKNNTKIQINYNKSPVEFYFKPTQETFDDFNTLSSSVSSLSDEQMYCKRKKWLSCAVRAHKCDWIGERNDKFKCQPKASSGAPQGGPPAPGALPPCDDPNDAGKGTTCSGGSRNISKQKKKVIRNLSKRRYF